MKRIVTLVSFIALATVSLAQSLYFDASSLNTIHNDGTSVWSADTAALDSLWGLRILTDGRGYEGTLYESTGIPGAEDSPMIITTATGLTPGQLYQVDVVYWSSINTTNNWNVKAGFDAGSMVGFDRLGTLGTAGTQMDLFSSTYSLAGTIGTIAADGSGNISVYIDDLPGTNTTTRSWYDGVQVTAVPEPATFALLAGLGVFVFAAIRRRRQVQAG